jgi:hypothetical protein
MTEKITIDGTEYDTSKLSELARSQITNLRATDQEIARTESLVAMLRTARLAYAQALKNELNKAK